MPLLRKELRALVPFIGLVLFLSVLNVVDELIAHQPDMRPLSTTLEAYVAPGTWSHSVFLFLVVFTLGSGLLVREQDEGTIEFLDSLPVSRSRVFWTKFTLASLVFCLLPLTNLSIAVGLHLWSRTSLDPSFHWGALWTSFFLSTCQATVFLALALLLSFLRRFSWLVVALLFWTYILASHFYPGVVAINPFQLTTPRFEGQHWMLPADLLKAQLPLAAVMLLMAWFLFAGAGDRLARAYQKLTLSRAGVGMLAGAVAVTVILVIALIVYVGAGDPERRDVGAPKVARAVYADWTNAHAQSQFFSFVYPANLSDRAREAIAQADNIHEAVRKFLGSDSGGSIAVDMTGASPRHAGVAYWNTIRLDLAELEDPDTLRAVLGHETVHVYVNRISESRVEDAFNSTRFFNEGLATYLEHRLFGSAKTAQPERSMAAVMRHRREVDFEELIDNALLGRNRDVNAVYPLGEVFVAALVERYGDQAPGALLRAFARKDRPKQMQGMELWQDAFQSAGFSLETAIDAFYARLDGLVAENREFIARLPRIRGAVHFEEALIGVEPLGTPLAGWIVVCRLRQAEDTDEQRYITPFPDDDGTFWVTRSSLPAATFWFQLGIHEVGGNRTIWEPWSEIRRP